MIININRNILLDSVSKVNRIIDHKIYNPSLTGIYMEAKDEGLTIISSRGDQSIKFFIKADGINLTVKEQGKILVKPKYFLEILRRFEDNQVNIIKTESNQIKISGDLAEFNLNAMEEESYPLLGFYEEGDYIVVDGEELKKSLFQTSVSVNETHKQLILTGLNFSVRDNFLFVSATDLYRISQKKIDIIDQEGLDFSINIMLRSVNEIGKLIENEKQVKIIKNEDNVSFIIGNCVFRTTMLIGQFPDISNAFPKDFNSVISLGNKEFSKVIQRADITTEESNSVVVNFRLDGDKIVINAIMSEVGNFEEEFLAFDLVGADQQMLAFNSKYFLEAIKTFNTKVIQIKIIDRNKPILIASNEEPNLVQMVLPMIVS